MNIDQLKTIIFFIVWLAIVTHQRGVCTISRRIFDTTIIFENNDIFDCLILPHSEWYFKDNTRHSASNYYFEETHQYCRRSTVSNSHQMFLIENSTKNNHPVLTFDDLRSMGVTYQQLYEWYAPIDLIEEYIAGEKNGSFVNCSDTLWFGSNCEYTFNSNKNFVDIIIDQFNAKRSVPIDLSLFTNGTCYEMNNTDCESIICLDWREICDGKIDCKNGYDERHCQELEMNECNSITEHRCYDGQCVDNSQDVYTHKTQCLEEYKFQNFLIHSCYTIHGYQCENRKCASLLFSCGDGYCYDGPSIGDRSCPTQRDRRYLEQMPSSSLILFSHMILIYNNTQPKYICYNQTLCPYLSVNNHTTTIHNNGLTCRAFETFTNRTYNKFDEIVKDVKRFVRSCSLLPFEYNDARNSCSMFRCDDDSKCLSFHRLSDDVEDCTNGEDENQIDVCSYNLTDRFTCDNRTKCISGQLFNDGEKHCMDGTDESILATVLTNCSNIFSDKCYRIGNTDVSSRVNFYQLCNGLVEYASDLNNNTDESECLMTEWPCDASFFKCDRVWNCPDGRDELECKLVTRSSLYCNNSKHFCLQINTSKPICLSTLKVGDGIIDCVGSFDEREFCRSKYPFEERRRYRCQNSTKCIPINYVCDCIQDCPENDDETIACSWFYDGQECDYPFLQIGNCNADHDQNYDSRSDLFCDLSDERNDELWFDHQRQESSSIATEHQLKRQTIENPNYHVIWSCNRGIYVQSTKDPEGFACLCSVYYYGHRCQYQRKRVSINLQMQTLTSFNHRISAFIFVVLLIHTNISNITIISHDQFIYIPRYECRSGISIQLLYPIKEPYRSFTNHSVHIHVFDKQTLEHRKSWDFPLAFEFLPVQQIFKQLDVPEIGTDFESRQISIPYSSCTLCLNNSFCIGHDVSLGRDICICRPNYVGRRCLFRFDPCINNVSCNGRGICQPTDIYYDSNNQFICLCDLGWIGPRCKQFLPRINVSLATDLTFLSSNIAFLHVTSITTTYRQELHRIYLQHFQKETLNLTFLLEDPTIKAEIAFIQFYEHQYKFDYYFLFYNKLFQKPLNENVIEVQSSDRCRPINELFNRNILLQPDIRRVKNYQQPCLQRHYHKNQFLCFYDDYLMCVCQEDNYTNCFSFKTNLNTCDKKWCNNRGMCVKDDKTCTTYSRCICEPCVYGSFCQFSTGGYSLSLDGIIGSHILLTASSLSEQSIIVQTAVILISIVTLLGIILNMLSISTFIQRETHEVGCGLYLLASSIIGLLTQIVLISKMILLLMGERSNVSCSVVEFFLKWCPTSCEWFNACVAFERTIAVKRKMKYSRSKSKYFSKWITPIVFIMVGLICMPELLFRGIILDPIDERAWCVLKLNNEQPGLLAFYSILNVISFIIPLIINLSSGIIIIYNKFKSKQKTNKINDININNSMAWKIHLKLIRTQILRHEDILIGPIILGCLSLPRLILTFIFVCTKLDQNSIPSLITYLIGFLPSMAIIFAFVCPSETYRLALIKTIKTIVPQYVRNLCRFSRN